MGVYLCLHWRRVDTVEHGGNPSPALALSSVAAMRLLRLSLSEGGLLVAVLGGLRRISALPAVHCPAGSRCCNEAACGRCTAVLLPFAHASAVACAGCVCRCFLVGVSFLPSDPPALRPASLGISAASSLSLLPVVFVSVARRAAAARAPFPVACV